MKPVHNKEHPGKEENHLFIAKTSSGDFISVLNGTYDAIKDIKKHEPFFCPSCNGELILKMGVKKIPHFAHKTKCPIKPEGESEIHLLGKKKLYEWLTVQGFQPRMEVFLSALNQQPDLLFEWGGKKVAVEFQCSIIQTNEIKRRTLNYLKYSYWPLWIVNQKHVTTRYGSMIHLSEFLTGFINKTANGTSFLLSFNPETDCLYLYNNIIPFSINRAYTTINKFTLKDTLVKVLSQKRQSHRFYENWNDQLEKWIQRLSLMPNGRNNPFLQFLYHHQIHVTELPPEIGLPVRNMFLIYNHPMEWQFYIWFYFLYRRKKGEAIPVQQIKSFVVHSLKQIIKFRDLVLFSESEHYRPVHDYLQILTDIGFFSRVGDKLIVKKEPKRIVNPHLFRQEKSKDFYRRYKAIILKPFLLTE